MPLVSMRQLLDEAARGGYGVGAFNVNNMEQIQAIMEAARETSSPVIIQASRGARSYTNDRFLWHLMQAAVELYPEIPVALHLDHGNEPATCISAIDLGFTSVMMDGSLEADGKTPASFEYNVAVTQEVVEYAHARGVTVEGEIGTLGGIEDGHGSGEVHLTDPDEAVEFVAADAASTRSPSRSAPRTAPTSSRRSRRRGPEDGPDRGDPSPPARDAPRHARLVERAARARRAGQPVRRRAQARVGRAGEGDPARDPPRRPQDQRRHRLPPRRHRRDPQGVRRDAREVRPARLPEARPRRDAGADRNPDARLRPGRPRRRLRGALARGDARGLRRRCGG